MDGRKGDGVMELVDFKDDFNSNLTACFGCEELVLFSDLWFGEYCCKGCAGTK